MRVAVFGAGSWGTASSMILADAGCDVTLWARRPALSTAINSSRTNPDYLPGIDLPDGIRATHDPAEATEGAGLIVLAVPAQHLRENLIRWVPVIPDDATFVSLIKGVELHSAKLMNEVIRETTDAGDDRIAVLSGPNLAGEIVRRQPTASVVACTDTGVAQQVQKAFQTPYFRPFTNADVIGTELAGAVKNVIALAVGIAAGMGYGDNTRASLITRGLAETALLGRALGADVHTFSGLSGLGDLVATCSSPLSRNRSFGERLGRGFSVAEAAGPSRQVAEGVDSSTAILELAERHDVDMPIAASVSRVVRGDMTPHEVQRRLIAVSAKAERYGF